MNSRKNIVCVIIVTLIGLLLLNSIVWLYSGLYDGFTNIRLTDKNIY